MKPPSSRRPRHRVDGSTYSPPRSYLYFVNSVQRQELQYDDNDNVFVSTTSSADDDDSNDDDDDDDDSNENDGPRRLDNDNLGSRRHIRYILSNVLVGLARGGGGGGGGGGGRGVRQDEEDEE